MTNIYHRQKSCLLISLVAPKLLARQDGAQGPERNAQSLELNKHKESDKLSCSCFTKEFTGMSRTTQIILDETNQCWYDTCDALHILCWCHVVDESGIHVLLLSFVLFLRIIYYLYFSAVCPSHGFRLCFSWGYCERFECRVLIARAPQDVSTIPFQQVHNASHHWITHNVLDGFVC